MACTGPLCAQTGDQPDTTTPWRDALDRFERRLDETFDDLLGLDEVAGPQVGIFVPLGPTAANAALPPGDWVPLTDQPVPSTLVLLVHGLDEAGDIWIELAPALLEADHAVARFEYPNDQRIDTSSTLLLEHLRAARAAGVDEVAVVAHSMGGLVTFNAMTRQDGYAGKVETPGDLPRITRFVSVGTPWRGSSWAKLQAIGEVHEQVSRLIAESSLDVRPLLQYRRDGSGQAGDDLLPGSAFMTDLRERPWPDDLPLTIIAGRITNPDPVINEGLADSALLRELLSPDDLATFLTDLRAASADLGDGVVALSSALGRATDDSHVFPVNHRALLRHSPIDFLTGEVPETGPPGIPIILDRLREEPDQTAPPAGN